MDGMRSNMRCGACAQGCYFRLADLLLHVTSLLAIAYPCRCRRSLCGSFPFLQLSDFGLETNATWFGGIMKDNEVQPTTTCTDYTAKFGVDSCSSAPDSYRGDPAQQLRILQQASYEGEIETNSSPIACP
eukprot:GHVU01011359.1.p1 GENE.GHVU01011359.1~~GHVU01011359.1.p1  ORF type:complete len:130 (+),score=7.19 GHVU01011359.1:2114-2503(+)